jgi:hypothetical protein
MTVLISDLLRADTLDQPVTVYDAASGTYREFDMLIKHEGRLVLIRHSDLCDPSIYQAWIRDQL